MIVPCPGSIEERRAQRRLDLPLPVVQVVRRMATGVVSSRSWPSSRHTDGICSSQRPAYHTPIPASPRTMASWNSPKRSGTPLPCLSVLTKCQNSRQLCTGQAKTQADAPRTAVVTTALSTSRA